MTAPADHFQRFGLPRRYEIDLEALEAAYHRLTLEHHPDFFSTAGEDARRAAERTSAAVNEGYRTLRDDMARGDYLLGLLAAGRELDTTTLPDGFLQAMFLLQEEVEEVGDDPDAAEARAALRAQVTARHEAVRAERPALFAAAEARPENGTLQAVQANLNSERYLRRLLERLDGKRTD